MTESSQELFLDGRRGETPNLKIRSEPGREEAVEVVANSVNPPHLPPLISCEVEESKVPDQGSSQDTNTTITSKNSLEIMDTQGVILTDERIAHNTARLLAFNLQRRVSQPPKRHPVDCRNKFATLENEQGGRELSPPLVKCKWGRPVGRAEQRREVEHRRKKAAKHQGQQIAKMVSGVTVNGSLLPKFCVAKAEPEPKVSTVAELPPTMPEVAEKTSVKVFAPEEPQELFDIGGEEDWSELERPGRYYIHGLRPQLVEKEPRLESPPSDQLIDNRDLRSIAVDFVEYDFDYLTFLGIWNDTTLSSAGNIYAEHYGRHVAQSKVRVRLPSTLVNELKAFWVNRRRDADLKEFNLSVIRCRKLCSELVLTSHEYTDALYYAPVIAYRDSWELQQQVGRVVTNDYVQLNEKPKWLLKIIEYFQTACSNKVGLVYTCWAHFSTIHGCLLAPIYEEFLKRSSPTVRHIFIWWEFVMYVLKYGPKAIPLRLIVAQLHYYMASQNIWIGILLHMLWNSFWAFVTMRQMMNASLINNLGFVVNCLRLYFRILRLFGHQMALTLFKSPSSMCLAKVLSGPPVKCHNLINSECEPPKELKPTARIGFKPPEDRLRKKEDDACPGQVAQLAFDTCGYKPVVYASNLHNEKQALDARVLAETPVPEGFYCGCNRARKCREYRRCKRARFKRLDDYCGFVKGNYRKLFRNIHKVKPLTFEAYLRGSNASPSVKKILRETKAELRREGIDQHSRLTEIQLHRWTKRKSFVKVENNLYQTELGLKKKAPRLIQGAPPEFIVLVGPWIAALQIRLKKLWGRNSPLCFTSGLSALEIGEYADLPGWKYLEDDVSAWDTSLRKQLCELEVWLCEKFGAPRAVIDLMIANLDTHGITMHGWRYRVEGTRKSGDPFTSLFNSVHNALLHLFIYCDVCKVLVDQALLVVKMLVQGDDNLLMHRRQVKIDWVQEMRRLGFKSEGIPRKSLDEVEFCSGRFYCTNKGYCYGPKPGKVLAKFGYVVNPPKCTREGLMRGIALGLQKQVNFIPPLKSIVDRVLHLTEGVTPEFLSEWQLREAHKARLNEFLDSTDDVDHALYVQYQWGPTQQKQWDRELATLKLGDVLNSPLSTQLIDRDTSGPQLVFGGFTTPSAT